jgi:hypothetical protein
VLFICLVRHDGYNYFVSFFLQSLIFLCWKWQCSVDTLHGKGAIVFLFSRACQPKIEEGIIWQKNLTKNASQSGEEQKNETKYAAKKLKKGPDKRISQKLQAKIGEQGTWQKNLTKEPHKKELEKKKPD